MMSGWTRNLWLTQRQNKMAMIRNPFNKGRFIRVNDYPDDIVIDNPSDDAGRNREFFDLPRTDQLTQNSWNMSPYTRENRYDKVIVDSQPVVGRMERYRKILNPRKYKNHGVGL